MTLEILWFCLIAFFWASYLVLEGFDLGVGMLLPVLGRDESSRRLMLESIGPVWDGNEVWVVIAGAGTFAAFPQWYATLFSGFYLALLLVLVLLIVRVVSFEWRSKGGPGWQSLWTTVNATASVGIPFVWGVALTTLLHGVPIARDQEFAGSFGDLFTGYSVLGGIAFCLLFALHGAAFLALKTDGSLRRRASGVARLLAPAAALVGAGFLAWTIVVAHDRNDHGLLPGLVPAAVAAGAAIGAVLAARGARERLTFVATTATVAGAVATLFASLYPRVLVSSPGFANSLTIENAASSHYSLTVMTVVAVVLVPVILVYQAWTYSVFRARLQH